MKLEAPREIERFGAVRFGGMQKVFELDSGLRPPPASGQNSIIQQVPYEALYEVQKDMAIVVPVRSERLKLIEGVLCGIPHQCLTIIVSNSPRTPVDRFSMERDALENFCMFVNKDAVIVHQKDPNLARAFEKAGYTSLLTQNEEIRDGKAEGMIIGILLAWLAGKQYVGFIDADNYFPGAVEEYIREYAAGFYLSKSPYTMVRIAWQSKPKIVESKLFFRKWGRSTANTNRLLNRLLSHYYGFETELIKTGNAGEHAMTLKLARRLDYSAGYSIEPYHIINLIEKFGGISESPFPEVMKQGVEVYQIESRNPHLHEAGDKEHIHEMTSVAMQVIYHSPICPEELKKEILADMLKRKFLTKESQPPRPCHFPALYSIDVGSFLEEFQSSEYTIVGNNIRHDLSLASASSSHIHELSKGISEMSKYALLMTDAEGLSSYPLTTPEKPGQGLNPNRNESLLRHTYNRISSIFRQENIFVSVHHQHSDLAKEQLPEIGDDRFIGHLSQQKPALCTALAAWLIFHRDAKAVMAVFPSTHFIREESKFQPTIRQVIAAVKESGRIVTLGISPTRPSTEFGYLKLGAALDHPQSNLYRVEEFVEHPSERVANESYNHGGYLWSSGIFVGRAEAILHQIEAKLSGVYQLLEMVRADDGLIRVGDVDRFFANAETLPIDDGPLERSLDAIVLYADLGWRDSGSIVTRKPLVDNGNGTSRPELERGEDSVYPKRRIASNQG